MRLWALLVRLVLGRDPRRWTAWQPLLGLALIGVGFELGGALARGQPNSGARLAAGIVTMAGAVGGALVQIGRAHV